MVQNCVLHADETHSVAKFIDGQEVEIIVEEDYLYIKFLAQSSVVLKFKLETVEE